MNEEIELTKLERVNLYNQYWILSLIDRDNAQYCKRMMNVLENGYQLEYTELTSRFANLSVSSCRFVHDVLAMHLSFEDAKSDGVEVPKESSSLFDYHGFDGNNETMYRAYAQYLVEQPHRFDALKGKYDNTHMPTLERYRVMLKIWDELPNKHKMEPDDFTMIATAWEQYREP